MGIGADQVVGVVFPGQGAQFVGMGRDLHDESEQVRALFEEASTVLDLEIGKIMFEGPAEELTRTEISQPAIFLHSAAILALLDEEGGQAPVPGAAATAGLSLGEYTAHYFAGTCDFSTAIRLVAERGRAMQAACDAAPSGMLSAIGITEEKAAALCESAGDGIWIAGLNSPGQIVLGGRTEALDAAEEAAKEHGARRTVRLDVAGAFHTPLMAPAVERLRAALEAADLTPPRLPVLANATGAEVGMPEEVVETLVAQLTKPVRWIACLERMAHLGVKEYVEPGPGRVLAGLQRRIQPDAATRSLGTADDVRGYLGASSNGGEAL